MSCNITTSTYHLCISITLQKKGSRMSDLISCQHFRVSYKGTNSVAAVWMLCIRKRPQFPNTFSLMSLLLLCSYSLFLFYLIQATKCQSFCPDLCKLHSFPLSKYPPPGEYSWNLYLFSQIKNLSFLLLLLFVHLFA